MQLARQQQILGELIREELGARRIVEREGRERIDDPVGPRQTPVVSLHPEDGGENLGRHARAHARSIELLAMRQPELRAFADAPLAEEDRPVLVPRLGLLGRLFHGFQDRGLAFRGVEPFTHGPLLEPVLTRHLRDERLHVGAMCAYRGGRLRAREPEEGGEKRGRAAGEEAPGHEPINLR